MERRSTVIFLPMSNSYSRTLRRLLLVWALLAAVVVALGLFARLPVFAAQGAIALQMLIFFAVLAFSPGFRGYLFSRDLRLLTAFHTWRIIPGAAFLYYFYVLHKLPWGFAVPGGYGDIVVGLTALPVSLLAASSWSGRWGALLAWHALGFIDLAGVVRAALVNGLHNPESMRPLTHFPLSLLPAMLVALTFMVHIIAAAQCARRQSQPAMTS
jgi:hypothetical protein